MYECTQKIIKNKVGLLNLAEELGNVSRACKVMGFSRDTFYRYKSAVEEGGGVESLLDKSRRQPNLKNRVDEPMNKRYWTTLLNVLPMAKSVLVMKCVKEAFLSHLVAFDQFGYATT